MNSETANLIPPEIRQALHNAADRYTNLYGHYPVQINPAYWTSNGYQLTAHQRSYSIAVLGSWNPAAIAFCPQWPGALPEPSYPLDFVGFWTVQDQWQLIADDPYTTPLPKRKVSRSYWTGIHRRRRNL